MIVGFDAAPARELAEAHMTQRANILSVGKRRTSGGRLVEGERSPVEENVPCRFRMMTAREAEVAGQIAEQVEGVVLMPAGTPVENEHLLVLDGAEYAISGVMPQTDEYKAQEKVMVRRL